MTLINDISSRICSRNKCGTSIVNFWRSHYSGLASATNGIVSPLKKFVNIAFLASVVGFSQTSHADPVTDIVETKISEYSTRSDIVMVIFKAKGDVNVAISNVKRAMHTRDPNGLMNPYWIVSFPNEAISMKTNCGVVVGQWYTPRFLYRATWEQIMYRALQENVEFGAYYYSQGHAVNLEDVIFQTPAFKKISESCLAGKFRAQAKSDETGQLVDKSLSILMAASIVASLDGAQSSADGISNEVIAENEPMDAAKLEKMRATTITAFKEYLDFRDKANGGLERGEVDNPGYYELRISQIRRIDIQSIDPALVAYLHVLEQEFTETLPIARQAKQEGANLERALNTTGNLMYDMSESGLGDILARGLSTGLNDNAIEAFKARWDPEFQRVNDKYLQQQKSLLQELSKKFNYGFYTIVFGNE